MDRSDRDGGYQHGMQRAVTAQQADHGGEEDEGGEMEAEMEHMYRMVPLANQAGVRMVLGDDYGIVIMDHGTQSEEPAFYVNEIGIPPLDVIRWATINGAVRVATEGCAPLSDPQASDWYRLNVLPVHLARLLRGG